MAFGISFLPGGNGEAGGEGIEGPGGLQDRYQEAIRLLQLRLPRVFGGSPLAPSALLNAPSQGYGNSNAQLQALMAMAGLAGGGTRGGRGAMFGGPAPRHLPAPTVRPGLVAEGGNAGTYVPPVDRGPISGPPSPPLVPPAPGSGGGGGPIFGGSGPRYDIGPPPTPRVIPGQPPSPDAVGGADRGLITPPGPGNLPPGAPLDRLSPMPGAISSHGPGSGAPPTAGPPLISPPGPGNLPPRPKPLPRLVTPPGPGNLPRVPRIVTPPGPGNLPRGRNTPRPVPLPRGRFR